MNTESCNTRIRSGFTLVELSIVLVILGLLTGGILAGQSLIRAAELRAVTSEYQRYATAAHTFRDKYFGIPGDFRDATRFWGRSSSNSWCITNSSATINATTGVCDGDGDGILIDTGATANQSGEMFQFWRQLAAAGLIEGTYSGIAGNTSGVDHDYGTNAPASRLTNAGWGSSYVNNSGGGLTSIFQFNYRNSLVVGGDDGNWSDNPRFKAEEAWNIDTKMDDGKPGQGKIHTYPAGGSCSNAASNTDFNAEFTLTNTTQNACVLIFRP